LIKVWYVIISWNSLNINTHAIMILPLLFSIFSIGT
jgi:hypothetical protein